MHQPNNMQEKWSMASTLGLRLGRVIYLCLLLLTYTGATLPSQAAAPTAAVGVATGAGNVQVNQPEPQPAGTLAIVEPALVETTVQAKEGDTTTAANLFYLPFIWHFEQTWEGPDFFLPPPECDTSNIPLYPLPEGAVQADLPYWQFVLNFNIWRNNRQPLACVLLYRQGESEPFHAITLPCQFEGSVRRTDSSASFAGGYVSCSIHLQNEVAALNDSMALEDMYEYSTFTIAGVGRMEATDTLTETFSNPIVIYRSTEQGNPSVGLFTPLRWVDGSKMGLEIAAGYNGERLPADPDSELCLASTLLRPLREWGMTLKTDSQTQITTVTHWQDEEDVCVFDNSPRVEFWTNGGVFYIGGLPADDDSFIDGEPRVIPLQGLLDEVIVDPTGSTRPPR